MKLEDLRTSFTVYLVAGDLDPFSGLADTLGLAGYLTASFSELTAAFSEMPSNPPHMILFDATEKKFDLKRVIAQVRLQLPESHVFLLTPLARRAEFVPMLEDGGVYDLIYLPLASPIEALRALDRAAERDSLMYLREGEAAPAPRAATLPPENHGFLRQIFAQATPERAVRLFLNRASEDLGRTGILYFNYIANRRVLLAAQGEKLGELELGGLGINFNQTESEFKTDHLRDPAAIPELAQLVEDVFGVADFFAFPVEVRQEIHGVVVFLGPLPAPELTERIGDELTLLNKALTTLELEKRLHAVSVKDPITELLARGEFNVAVEREISRARRTRLPVTLLQIAVDPLNDVEARLGAGEGATLLRVVARILQKQSRVMDVLGRTGVDEIGIILPNTNRRGAMVKAERMRTLIAAADFSKVLAAFPRVTISVGISEYPSLVRDGEELVSSASDALYGVRARGNTTCLAVGVANLVPDFTVRDEREAN